MMDESWRVDAVALGMLPAGIQTESRSIPLSSSTEDEGEVGDKTKVVSKVISKAMVQTKENRLKENTHGVDKPVCVCLGAPDVDADADDDGAEKEESAEELVTTIMKQRKLYSDSSRSTQTIDTTNSDANRSTSSSQDRMHGAFRAAPGSGYTRTDRISFSHVGSSQDLLGADDYPAPESALESRTESQMGQELEGEAGVPVAKPVENEDDLVTVDIDLESQGQAASSREGRETEEQKKRLTVTLLALTLLVALVVGVAVWAVSRRDAGSEPTTAATTTGHSSAPNTHAAAPQDKLLSLLPDFTQLAIGNDAFTPQAKAYQWLLADPRLDTYSDSRLLQRFALATFYFSTDGPGWKNQTNWLDHDVHECKWAMEAPGGMWYDADLHDDVSRIRGPCSKDNDEYERLWFIHNNLEGAIPREIGLLTSLVDIDLSNNRLSASLPSQLGHLVHVRRLYVFGNGLTGSLPTEVGLLQDLTELHLQINHLQGSLPTELGVLSNLEWFWGFDNMFSGALPSELGKLNSTKMRRLELFDNALSGSIPTQLGLLTSLGELTVDKNQLTGTIPSELGQLNVGLLSVQANQLTGRIPTELGNLKEAYRLYLYSNQLTGTLPTELGELSNMENLLLHDNQLSGPIPSELGNLEKLWALYLSFNQQTGIVPPEWGGGLTLKYDWEWDQNRFTGSLPSTLGQLSSLHYMWLPSNDLTGTVPTEFGLMTSLAVLSIAQNEGLSGTLPVELTSGSLAFFNISGCSGLIGTIPTELCLLKESSFAFDCSDELCGCDGWCECPPM